MFQDRNGSFRIENYQRAPVPTVDIENRVLAYLIQIDRTKKEGPFRGHELNELAPEEVAFFETLTKRKIRLLRLNASHGIEVPEAIEKWVRSYNPYFCLSPSRKSL
jgi:hypothetical protein